MIFATLTNTLIIASFLGCVAFVATYRPYSLRAHGPAGRHLLTMSWSLLALYGMTLLLRVVEIPLLARQGATVVILGAICFAVWQRCFLLWGVQRRARHERNHRA